jgi:beta-galactosidase/beta-glucuronidase
MSTLRHATDLDHGRAYPRPQLVRSEWRPLLGTWAFALDGPAAWRLPRDVTFDATIDVPFAPECPASGVGDTGFYSAAWYAREVRLEPPTDGGRVLLHFGAVDHQATVWVNDALVGSHEGGYTPFCVDITDALVEGRAQRVVVRAFDDPQDLAKPRGKQDWQLDPHSIWYPRTTGIWQTVWIEHVPPTWIGRLRWTPNLERWELGLEVDIHGRPRSPLRLHVTLRIGDTLIADDTYTVINAGVQRRIALSDPGIDDYRNELLWSPHSPRLITAELELWGDRGERLDVVGSYTALRAVAVQGDRFVLNGRPFPLRLVLDQGYWPSSGLTAPDDEALRRDVELARAMGFNGVRKHQKIEDPRFLYWADRLGLLVWEEMPSAYRFTQESIARVTREWTCAMQRDASHPCIVAWVPINESWGVPNLPDNPAERHYVRGLYHLTKTLDPTRPVIGNDGWESVATDIMGIHDYDDSPQRIARRYRAEEVLPRLFRRERPGGRVLVLEGQTQSDQPIVLSEFGGICYAKSQEGVWGYSRSTSAAEFAKQYRDLLHVVRRLNILAGFCYTQFADTYQEANGLLYADRTPKIPIEEIAQATSGWPVHSKLESEQAQVTASEEGRAGPRV